MFCKCFKTVSGSLTFCPHNWTETETRTCFISADRRRNCFISVLFCFSFISVVWTASGVCCAGTRSDQVFQDLSGVSCGVFDEGRRPLPGGCPVSQQHTCRRRYAVESRTACDACATCTQVLLLPCDSLGDRKRCPYRVRDSVFSNKLHVVDIYRISLLASRLMTVSKWLEFYVSLDTYCSRSFRRRVFPGSQYAYIPLNSSDNLPSSSRQSPQLRWRLLEGRGSN